MRFAVVIPVYNSAPYLHDCVQSVLTQEVGDFEIILIDDGSTDSSWDICQELNARDNRICIRQQDHQGPSAARNLGLRLSTADYVTFMDSDDVITSGTFAAATDSIERHDPDLVIFSMQHVDRTGPNETRRTLEIADQVYPDNKHFLTDLVNGKRLLLYSAANKFYKRSTLDRHSIRFSEEVEFGEDRLFNINFLRHARQIVTNSHCAYLYFIRQKLSLSRRFRPNHIAELLLLHEAKCGLANEFAPDHPKRETYRKADLAHELRSAVTHLVMHWPTLTATMKRREAASLIEAPYPAYFHQLTLPTRNRRLLHFMIRRRWTWGVRLALSLAAKI